MIRFWQLHCAFTGKPASIYWRYWNLWVRSSWMMSLSAYWMLWKNSHVSDTYWFADFTKQYWKQITEMLQCLSYSAHWIINLKCIDSFLLQYLLAWLSWLWWRLLCRTAVSQAMRQCKFTYRLHISSCCCLIQQALLISVWKLFTLLCLFLETMFSTSLERLMFQDIFTVQRGRNLYRTYP